MLDKAGILKGIKSTHSTNEDIINNDNVITARANVYVDFAIEVAKEFSKILIYKLDLINNFNLLS